MAAHRRSDQSRVCLYAGVFRKRVSVAAVIERDTNAAGYRTPILGGRLIPPVLNGEDGVVGEVEITGLNTRKSRVCPVSSTVKTMSA